MALPVTVHRSLFSTLLLLLCLLIQGQSGWCDTDKPDTWATQMALRKKWWSFQPIKSVVPPALPNQTWASHPVDRFILARLKQSGLRPSPVAEPATLVRRLYFTLIGLPPTPAELASGVGMLRQTGGYEALVDALLARPQFGETWARHWMDWTRYADSHGSEGDPDIQNGWLYRDYLIRALNDDVGYDQLVREHVAGDLLPKPRINKTLGINESVIGPAHWRMVFHGFAPTDALEEKVRFTDDEIGTFSKAFLGLTIACARCHNHKFDPISQRDYYALFGVLNSCRPGRSVIDLPEKQNRNREQLLALKSRIRSAIAAAWLSPSAQATLHQRLSAPPPQSASEENDLWKQAANPSALLYPLFVLRNASNDKASKDNVSKDKVLKDKASAEAWGRLVNSWQADRQGRREYAAHSNPLHWNLAQETDYRQWFKQGLGLPEHPTPAGEFAVATTGNRALSGIYPAGVYTHLLSPRQAARLTSGYIRLDGDYQLWVRVLGEGGASLRPVVQSYPRDGTVFPVSRLGPEWQWARFDMNYWNGDEMHVELAAGRDAPLLVANEANSWFGVREVAVVRKGDPPPPANPQEYLDPIFDALSSPALSASAVSTSALSVSALSTSTTVSIPVAVSASVSKAQLIAAYERAILGAVRAWQETENKKEKEKENQGKLSDAQASMLDRCVASGLLPNSLEALPDVRPLLAEYRRLEAEIESPTRVPGLEEGPVRNQPLYQRGNHKTPGPDVARAFLEVFDAKPYPANQSGRLQLAEDLLRDDNPLTRRVIVNRLWHHLFGRGIVGTPDNFGRLGQEPTHPELLDYLATRFKTHGWSIKETLRFLVTSRTWQLASRPSPQAQKVDPDNRLLSHANVRRLEAEAIRDSLLAVSGTLSPQAFGPPTGGDSPRRSVYVRVQRNALDPFLRAFDFPEPFSAVGRRDVTNVPAQSLTLMNDARVATLAANWADRLLTDPKTTVEKATLEKATVEKATVEKATVEEARIQQMFLAALGRNPTPTEVARARAYLQETQTDRNRLASQLAERRKQRETHRLTIDALMAPARDRLLADAKIKKPDTSVSRLPQPIGRWDFKTGTQDQVGSHHGILQNGAHLQDGALVLNGQGYLVTAPIQKPLREKTLEAWVQLDSLSQSGGGVMSVMTPDGGRFDAIVFGEQQPQRWMSGSNFFERTQSFNGSAEAEANQRPVHIAIAYHADGTIACYRDGLPYGSSYKSSGPFPFEAGQTVICFGIRHLPVGGNKMLAGKIFRAQLYDRALSADEILASSRSASYFVSKSDILAALSAADRATIAQHEKQISALEAEIAAMGPIQEGVDSNTANRAAWTDLARALFNFKEFIYLN